MNSITKNSDIQKKSLFSNTGKTFFAAVAAMGLAATTPAFAHDDDHDSISFGSVHFDIDEDLLPQIVELDADEIEDLRVELADAREDISDAIADVDEAREDTKGIPGAGVIVKIAMSFAARVADETVSEVFGELRSELSVAETELKNTSDDYSAQEYQETLGAIKMMKSELTSIDHALEDLFEAMRG